MQQLRQEPPAGEKYQLVAYPIKSADPTNAVSILQSLFPSTKFVLDAKTNRLMVWTGAAEHESIKSSIAQIEKPDPDAPELGFFTFKQAPPASLMTVLKNAAPRATLTLDADGKRLTIFASPADQAMLKAIIERVEKIAPPEEKNQLVVYPVTPAQRTRFQTLLTTISTELPGVKVLSDSEPGELAVWAKPQQHEMIREIMQQLCQEPPAGEKYQMVAYQLKAADPTSVLSVLTQMFPNTKFVLDKKTSRLAAWTRPSEQEAIKAAVEQLDSGAPADGQEKVTAYPLSGNPVAAVEILREMFPDVRFQPDWRAGSIIAWARPKEHEKIKLAIEQLQVENSPEKKPRLEVYPIDTNSPSQLIATLSAMAPNARIIHDAANNSLTVWANTKDQETIKAGIEKLGEGGTLETARQVEIYRLTKADPTATLTLLQTLVPRARLAVDARTQSLIAVATLADQKTIRGTLEQLQPEKAGPDDPDLRFYPLTQVPPPTLVPGLHKLAPKAQVTLDPSGKRLMVVATAAEHQVIKSNLDRVEKAAELEEKSQLVTYPVTPAQRKRFQAVVATVTTELPGLQVIADAEPGELSIWAKPSQHAVIAKIIDQLKRDVPAEEKYQLTAYSLKAADPDSVLTLVTRLFPNTQFTLDKRTKRLMAWARPEDHEAIKKALDEVDTGVAGDNEETLITYPVKTDPRTVVQMLPDLFPGMQFSSDLRAGTIVAKGRKIDHKQLAKTIEQMDQPDEAHRPQVVVYPIPKGELTQIRTLLVQLVPAGTFTVDTKARNLTALATPKDHETIRAAIEKMTKEGAAGDFKAVTYAIESAAPLAAMAILKEAAPDALLTAGSEPRQIVAWARAADHKVIEEIVKQMSDKGGADTASKVVVYPLQSTPAAMMVLALHAVVPEARCAPGGNGNQLIAYARPSDHAMIQEIIEKMESKGPPDKTPTVAAYTLESAATVTGAITFLTAAVPGAKFAAGAEPNQLVAWALPADQEVIKDAVAKMSQKDPPEKAPRVVTYILRSTGAMGAMRVLTAALPRAQFAVGTDPSQLIAYARPADHEMIKTAVEQMEAEGLADTKRVLAIYPMKNKDAAAMMQVLDPMLLKNARFVTDPDRDGLIVWAEPKQQEAIKGAVEQFLKELPKSVEPSSRVYRFRRADPKAAATALTKLTPAAQVALDTVNRSILVSALPEDHEKIAAMVKEMDRDDAEGQGPALRIHRVTSADPQNLLLVLQGLFKQRPDVLLSLDTKNDAVVAVATPDDHATIRRLIDQVEQAAPGESAAKLQLYPLKGIDSLAAMDVLTKLLEKQGAKVQLSVESRSNNLVALARPEQHALIREALDHLRTQDRTLEILQLETVEPTSAMMAITRLFSDDGLNAPEVDVDPSTQQLLLRGSKEQLAQIRDLLAKMGETGLKSVRNSGGGALRVVPFSGDAQSAVDEIRRIWPQPRQNQIRVVTPSAVAPLLRRERDGKKAEEEKSSSPAKKTDGEKPKEASPNSPPKENVAPPAKPQEPPFTEAPQEKPPSDAAPKKNEGAALLWPALPREDFFNATLGLGFLSPGATVTLQDDAPADAAAPPAKPKQEVGPSEARTAAGKEEQAEKPPAEGQKPAPPIFIAPSDGGILIASEDQEALDQLESLLRTMSQRGGMAGRNFTVFTLKNTSAARVATTLQQVFRSGQQTGGLARLVANPVTIVPDERTNSILVQANRSDRSTIENLLKVLDTAEVPDVLAAYKPRTIAIKNTRASRIEQVLRGVFKAQLATGTAAGGPAGTTGSTGHAPEIVVDDVANSLIIRGPSPLVDRIVDFARSLDESAGEELSRGLEIIPLKRTNATRVQAILDAMMKGGGAATTPRRHLATPGAPGAAGTPAKPGTY